MVATAGLLAAALALLQMREAPQEPALAARFVVDPPEGWVFDDRFGWPVPSPDGTQSSPMVGPWRGSIAATDMKPKGCPTTTTPGGGLRSDPRQSRG